MSINRKRIFELAIPSIIENILQISLSAADTYFVATLGAVAISAVGLNTLISNLYLTFFIALGTGAGILTARADGEGDMSKVKNQIRNGLLMTLAISAVFLLVNLIFGRPLLLLIGRDNGLVDTAYIYFAAVIIPIAGLSLMTVLSSLLKSLGDTRTPMYTVLIINILNVILDYIFIVGIGDFVGIGILGAGIATTVARFIGCIILVIRLEQRIPFLASFRFRFTDTIGEMTGYAIPVGLEKISMRVGQLVYGGLIIDIGIKHYAAHNIAGTIEGYSYLPAMGFGVAAFTLIGHAIGAGESYEIRRLGKETYRYAVYLMIGIGAVFFIFAPQLASIFTDDPEIIYLVTTVLRLIALFQPLLASTQVIASSLQALGDVRYPFYLTTIGIWVIRIIGTYVLGNKLGLGLIGVWISYVIDITFRGILLWLRFYKITRSEEYI